MALKIAIVVHGRFHAFDLARGLTDLGHEVTLFCSYPLWRVRRVVPKNCRVVVAWKHWLQMQLWRKTRVGRMLLGSSEQAGLKIFGRWAERQLSKSRWDAIYTWSSISEEILQSKRIRAGLKLVARGSTHIRFQDRLLAEEEERAGKAIERPESETIHRELREYDLADAIVCLSHFCKETFESEGIASNKIFCMKAGVDAKRFAPDPQVVAARLERIQSKHPLRIISSGALSFRKGAIDFAKVIDSLPKDRFVFRFVGSIADECRDLYEQLNHRVEFVPRVPQVELVREFAWGDVFLFLSLEEGLPQTLFQAAATGLPIIATYNSGAEDILEGGGTGWCVPVRDAKRVSTLLHTIECDRSELLARISAAHLQLRDWRDAATDLERFVIEKEVH